MKVSEITGNGGKCRYSFNNLADVNGRVMVIKNKICDKNMINRNCNDYRYRNFHNDDNSLRNVY